MRIRLLRPSVYIPLTLLVAAGWGAGLVLDGWNFKLNGSHSGLVVRGDYLSFELSIRWGWPSKAWIEREHLRVAGDGRRFREPLPLGFGVLSSLTTWNGNETITVRYVGLALPWGYLFLLAAASPLEVLARWLWSGRRSERRRRAGQCLRCGYDLRATPERCPECGAVATLV